MNTEWKLHRTEAGNTRAPASNIILNTVMLTTRVKERGSQFITVPKISKTKVSGNSRIYRKCRPRTHVGRMKELTGKSTKAPDKDILSDIVVVLPASESLQFGRSRRVGNGWFQGR